MARKTVLKQLLSKFAPMSVEMQDAAKFDQGVLGENNSVRYIDNEETAAIPESVDKATLTSREAISEAFIGGQITEQEADDLMQKIGITKNAVEDATVEAEVNLFDTKSAKR
jgi:recombination protein RecT